MARVVPKHAGAPALNAPRSSGDNSRRPPAGRDLSFIPTSRALGFGVVRALVLNATYEPLAVVTERRAAVLVLYGRADVLHGAGRFLRSASTAIELPSVVKLRYYVRAPQRRACAITRRGVFVRDSHRCQYCGKRAENIDHVHPRSRGGQHVWENVVAACRACNSRKRDRLPSEIRMRPIRPPRAPGRYAWVGQAVTSIPEAWREYILPEAAAAAS